jgi:prepilin-type processing-associated H-X9-DG protein
MDAPATTIIFCEESDFQYTYGETRGDSLAEDATGGPTGGNYNPAAARHSGGMNFVLGDGHCEWIRIKDYCRGSGCEGQPFTWDNSTSGGDWKKGVPYHWWFAPGIAQEIN